MSTSPANVTRAAFATAALLLGPGWTPPRGEIRFRAGGLPPFVHTNGACGRRFLVETMGSGVALFDADRDGDPDLLLVDGAPLPCCPPSRPARDRFFENLGGGTFRDATERSGLGDTGYGMGVAVGDVEGDGDLDVYLTNFGPDRLYRNRGDGTFEDVTGRAGLGDPRWGSCAAFADVDSDGDLDLFFGNYLDFSIESHRDCTAANGVPVYCDPDAYGRVACALFANAGDGTFVDATVPSGIGAHPGKALGVAAADLDEDGDEDLYVANDGVENFLFRNDGRGVFAEEGLSAGVAYGENALAQAGMGVACGDADGDGRLDLFVTNLSGETNAYYRNLGDGTFVHRSQPAGLGAPSLLDTGFGAEFVDLDLDGDLDLLVANGHVLDNAESVNDALRSRQPHRLYRNDGGRFREATAGAIPPEAAEGFGRGLAVGDVDGDGRPDAVVSQCGEAPYLYLNSSTGVGGSVSLLLVGTRSARDPAGARLEARAGGRLLVRVLHGGGSYLSHSDRTVLLGLGGAREIESLTVRWPSGTVQRLGPIPAGSRLVVREAPSAGETR
ncbi:MAG TPA: CRTAC1 family protein [Planctomycetota bacterium]|nr:CRTAC1 family protein [Planctomycetota bacterium]